MANARFQDLALVAQAGCRASELAGELGQVMTTPVPQFDPLQVSPDALVGVHIGGIAGQGFEVDPPGASLGQEVPHGLAAMDRRAVPDHQQLSGDLAQQVSQEAHDVRALKGAGQGAEEQAPIRRQAADGREVVVGQGNSQDRGLTPRRIGANPGGQEVEAGLVDPDDRAVLVAGFFSRAGQRSLNQASTLAWSRWEARTSGCWTLKPSARTRRLTWEG